MSFGDTWKAAANELIEPPRGNYKVRIDRGGSAFTSNKGDDCCKLNLEIIEGDLAGSKFEHFMWFGHEVGARINREALLAYGLEDPESIQTIEDLDDRIARLTGRTAELAVSYKDGRMNIRVSGSRAPVEDRRSDIPANGSGFDRTPEQDAQAGAAAARFGDEPAF
jgi:hypothetical protein